MVLIPLSWALVLPANNRQQQSKMWWNVSVILPFIVYGFKMDNNSSHASIGFHH
jgi:hypothetical protein